MTWAEAKAEIVNVLSITGPTVENLIENPSFETDIIGVTLTGPSGVRDATVYGFGTASLKVTGSGAATDRVEFTPYAGGRFDVAPSTEYSISMYGLGSHVYSGHIGIRWYTSLGGLISHAFTLGNATTSASGWTRWTFTGTSPVNAAFAVPNYEETAGFTAGRFLWIDGVMFNTGPVIDYFDGDSIDGTWSGTAHASTSSKAAAPHHVFDVPPNGFTTEQLPAFVIWPPAVEVQRLPGSYRKKVYTARITCMVSDRELSHAHALVEEMREAMIDAFDGASQLNGTAQIVEGPRCEEATTIAYGETRYTAFDAFLTVRLGDGVTYST